MNTRDVDLKRVYDAVIVGSGAAGGMAAHVLTSHGMQVLLLEAGKKLDIDKERKSMESRDDFAAIFDFDVNRL